MDVWMAELANARTELNQVSSVGCGSLGSVRERPSEPRREERLRTIPCIWYKDRSVSAG